MKKDLKLVEGDIVPIYENYILTFTKIGERKNIIKHEYFLTLDMAKELCMIENNEIRRKILQSLDIYIKKE